MRYDYVKFTLPLEQDRVQQMYENFRDEIQAWEVPGSANLPKLTVLGKTLTGSRLYIIECWGEASQAVEQLSWELWSPYLTRLDVKDGAWGATDFGVDKIYRELRAQGTRENLNQFASRTRAKVGGRTGGGTGFALGSHKSDLRFSLYKREGEEYHYEVQFTGQQLARQVTSVNRSVAVGICSHDFRWQALRGNIMAEGLYKLSRYIGNFPQVQAMLEMKEENK